MWKYISEKFLSIKFVVNLSEVFFPRSSSATIGKCNLRPKSLGGKALSLCEKLLPSVVQVSYYTGKLGTFGIHTGWKGGGLDTGKLGTFGIHTGWNGGGGDTGKLGTFGIHTGWNGGGGGARASWGPLVFTLGGMVAVFTREGVTGTNGLYGL